MPVIARYAIVTTLPLVLLLAGALFGGLLPVIALAWLLVLSVLFDPWLDPPAPAPGADPTWPDRLSAGLAAGQLILVPVTLLGLNNPALSAGAQLALFLGAASFMGQVSHPNAHELIHRARPRLHLLGAAAYVSMLFGHHVSAHRLVHHAHVGTPDDPATPLPGEGFWAYVPRAWAGSIRAGFEAEAALLERADKPAWAPDNPYYTWIAGAVIVLGISLAIGGFLGMIVMLALAGLVHLQILLSDYVQHYGLQRLILQSGRYEPVAAHHSWNAPRGFSSLLMLNAPTHSEHHLHPNRPFTELGQSETEAPKLPYSMPVMAVIATLPAAWRSLMDRRALRVMEAAEARLNGLEGRPNVAEVDLKNLNRAG